MNYIDIHTHHRNPGNHAQLVNVFPGEKEKFRHDGWFSVGLHPWHVEADSWQSDLDWVKEASQHERVLAIGETGLDKTITVPFDLQERVFLAQLRLAEAIRKPVVIHCVRSYSEMLAFRKKSDPSIPWIFHWFNSGEQMALELIRKNCYLSFGHLLFRSDSRACQVFSALPAGRIFMETDDAGFAIEQVYTRAAEIRGVEPGTWGSCIAENFRHCFGLKV